MKRKTKKGEKERMEYARKRAFLKEAFHSHLKLCFFFNDSCSPLRAQVSYSVM
jgi:hypothetical protein